MTAAIRSDEAKITGARAPAFVHLQGALGLFAAGRAITIAKLAKLAVGRLSGAGPHRTPAISSARWSSPTSWPPSGVQPIVGCTLQVDFGDRPQGNGCSATAPTSRARSRPARSRCSPATSAAIRT